MQIIGRIAERFDGRVGRAKRVLVRAELDHSITPRHMGRPALIQRDVHNAGLRANSGCHLSCLLSGGP